MQDIKLLIPEQKTLSLSLLSNRLADLAIPIHPRPFAKELIKFTEIFSQELLKDKEARDYPELQALGYWLRPSALSEMSKIFEAQQTAFTVPQGTVFHIPPGNIDTMFAYSFFMSLLCGNANIVRIPTKHGRITLLLLRILGQALREAPNVIKDQHLFLSYDHNAEITEELSKHANMRVIWGGDATIATVRQIPLPALASELVFPDRFSWSAINLNAFASLEVQAKNELALQYFNDVFWFDQSGCASPHVIIWCGTYDIDLTNNFYNHIAAVVKNKKWQLDIGANSAKQISNYSAMADYTLTEKRDFGDALTVFTLAAQDELEKLRAHPCFGGTLFELHKSKLNDIAPAIKRRDQTLTHFGFSQSELEDFAITLNGRGFDRIVPIGQALTFDTLWDGHNLLQSFTRLVKIQR